jgi:hypothetical protein
MPGAGAGRMPNGFHDKPEGGAAHGGSGNLSEGQGAFCWVGEGSQSGTMITEQAWTLAHQQFCVLGKTARHPIVAHIPQLNRERAEVSQNLEELLGVKAAVKNTWGDSSMGLSDFTLKFDELGGDYVFEITEGCAREVEVVDVLGNVGYLNERCTMAKAERASGHAPAGALIGGSVRTEVRTKTLRASHDPIIAHQQPLTWT